MHHQSSSSKILEMENSEKSLLESSMRHGKLIFEDNHQRFTKPSEYVRVRFDFDVDVLAKYIA
ncbi:hypothetical protein BpHYR1_019210, partial [Brachionus plicatilis]